MDMTGKVMAITGASRGIGAAAARVFAAAGARVGLMARSAREIGDLASEIGPAALALPCDVADAASVFGAVAQLEQAFGPVDVLINNAGVIEPIAPLFLAEPDAWDQAIDINFKGVFHGMRAVMPGMLARRSGTIITISSGAAHTPREGWSAYCSTKAGAAMLTRVAHHEAGHAGLRIMGLSPGTVATGMQVKVRASGINPVSLLDPSAHVPPDWPARTLLWMCGPEADDFLGQEVTLRDEGIRRSVGLIE